MNKLNLSAPSEQFFDNLYIPCLDVMIHIIYLLSHISLYQILANPTCESVDFISDITKYQVDIDVERYKL